MSSDSDSPLSIVRMARSLVQKVWKLQHSPLPLHASSTLEVMFQKYQFFTSLKISLDLPPDECSPLQRYQYRSVTWHLAERGQAKYKHPLDQSLLTHPVTTHLNCQHSYLTAPHSADGMMEWRRQSRDSEILINKILGIPFVIISIEQINKHFDMLISPLSATPGSKWNEDGSSSKILYFSPKPIITWSA